MIEKVIEALGKVADNTWAFSLFVLAASLAVVGHLGHDKDLLNFAGMVSTTGGVIFSRKKD